jgi:hypothetical protein
MLVDPEQKAGIERDLEGLNNEIRQLSAAKREKQNLANDLQIQIDKLDEDKVSSLP